MYDIEQLILDLLAICQGKLNAKLAAIDAEKDDGISLPQIPPNAYFFQSLDEEAAPFNQFVYFGVEDPIPDSNGPYAAESVTVYFIVVIKRTPESRRLMQKVLRYQRALKEIFQEGWANSPSGCKLSVSGLRPSDFKFLNNSQSHRAIGVQIQTTIG